MNKKNDNNKFDPLLVMCIVWVLMYMLPMLFMQGGAMLTESSTTEETVSEEVTEETLNITELATESESKLFKVEDLFIEVEGSSYSKSIFYFEPTGVLYMRCRDGEPLMLVDSEGNPYTYQQYERFINNR